LSFCLRFGFRRDADGESSWRINAASSITYHLIMRSGDERHFSGDGVRVTVAEHSRKISWRGVNVKMVRAEPKGARGVLDTLSKFDDVARLFASSSSVDARLPARISPAD